MRWFDDDRVDKLLNVEELIDALDKAFADGGSVPQKTQLFVPQVDGSTNKVLLMPAWGKMMGVKTLTIAPTNVKRDIPTLQSTYQLLDKQTGETLCFMDAALLTNRRTAAASALASKYLSRPDASVLLMMGCGSLAPELIKAHCVVRPITKVLVWARNEEKSQAFVESLDLPNVEVMVAEDIVVGMAEADIISCATLSSNPLIFGKLLRPGQHVDLAGSYKADMRESDDAVVEQCALFIDVFSNLRETGDFAIPLKSGVISESDIRADLHELCKKEVAGRLSAEQITLFKSCGYALEDLVAAELVWEGSNLESHG
jgi:ornithine cyclodeaminase/alanine dehydrogenase-like protein (mu-crystallin family)